jgi:hypothetical protein
MFTLNFVCIQSEKASSRTREKVFSRVSVFMFQHRLCLMNTKYVQTIEHRICVYIYPFVI